MSHWCNLLAHSQAGKLPHWANPISRVYINRPSIHLSCSLVIVWRPSISQRKPLLPAQGNQCTRCTIKTWFLLKKIRFNERRAGQQQMVRLIGSTKMECVFEYLSDQMPVFISKEWRYTHDNIKQNGRPHQHGLHLQTNAFPYAAPDQMLHNVKREFLEKQS